MQRTRFRILPTLFALAAATASAQSSAPTPALSPDKTIAPASESAAREGKELFAKVVESLGGKAKVARVVDIQTRGQVTTKGPDGAERSMDIQTAVVFPDHLSQQVDAPFGRLVMVATPAGAFILGPEGVQDLPPGLRDELLRQVLRVPLFLAQKAGDPKLSTTAAGAEKIGDVEARILDVAYPDMKVRWFVDPKTGRILRSSHIAMGPDNKELPIISDYSDFRLVDGYSIAFRLEVNTNGSKDQTLLIEECKINGGIAAKLFEKPPASAQARPTP